MWYNIQASKYNYSLLFHRKGPNDQKEVYKMKKYEIMYIVNASLDDAARAKLNEGLHAIITNAGGSIDNVDDWGCKEFAYEINHMTKGYYYVINVTANNEGIAEFDRLARINNSVVRFLIVKDEKAAA